MSQYFAETLRNLRAERGLTQRELAKKLETVGITTPEERIIQVGAAIGSHVGPDACGLVYVAK